MEYIANIDKPMRYIGTTLKKRIIFVVISFTVPLLALIGLLVFKKIMGFGFICPFHEYLHWDCPGCGGTRMIESILHGQLYQAFRYNAFIFINLPFLAALYIYECGLYIKTGCLSCWLDKVLLIYAVFLFAFGIIRNISIFSWLLPTTV